MPPVTIVVVFLLLIVLIVFQIRGAIGFRRAAVLGVLGVLGVGERWGTLEWSWRS